MTHAKGLRHLKPTVGILAIATHMPATIRHNDWWPKETVERWAQLPNTPPPLEPGEPTEAMSRVLAAMARQAFDPFQGVTERRLMPADMSSVDMEADAAERAIVHAGIDRGEIDLLLTHTAVPDYLLSNSACVLHRRLGLAPGCFTMQAEASGYSFMMQLSLAVNMIAAGQTRYALLVQSTASSRLLDVDDPDSAIHGDGAAATVVGPVPAGGVLASVHRTDGTHPTALVANVPGRHWYDDGRITLHRGDPIATKRVFLQTADLAIEVIGAALRAAGETPADVDFYAVHQGTPWLRTVTQESVGLTRARYVDTFPTTGYLFSVSIPLVLETAQRRGLISAGDLVVLNGGGVGATFGAIVLRWGDPVA